MSQCINYTFSLKRWNSLIIHLKCHPFWIYYLKVSPNLNITTLSDQMVPENRHWFRKLVSHDSMFSQLFTPPTHPTTYETLCCFPKFQILGVNKCWVKHFGVKQKSGSKNVRVKHVLGRKNWGVKKMLALKV